jgi:hypothetical protein
VCTAYRSALTKLGQRSNQGRPRDLSDDGGMGGATEYSIVLDVDDWLMIDATMDDELDRLSQEGWITTPGESLRATRTGLS